MRRAGRGVAAVAALLLLLSGCGGGSEEAAYQQITAEEARAILDENKDAVLLDVREQSEYDEGHIPGAVLLPVGDIDEQSAAALLADRETTVLVYCRSGNRSKKAAAALAELGYTAVYEFGGIQDWPYEIEREEAASR